MSEEERRIRRLLEAGELDIESDNFKQAGEKIHQAIQIAKNIGNEELHSQITEFLQGFTYSVETQSIGLTPIETDGFILDIGGGGRGIIGKLNGRQVVAIDKNERELEETKNEALKDIAKLLKEMNDFADSKNQKDTQVAILKTLLLIVSLLWIGLGGLDTIQ